MKATEQGNDRTIALVLEPAPDSALQLVRENESELRDRLRAYGAIVLKGVRGGIDEFNEIVSTLGGPQLEYTERSTPRSAVKGNVYTSTEYPPNQEIPMHNENSYSDTWPEYLYFLCETAPATGGCTPVADSRKVLEDIPDEVRERFQGGLIYSRTYREGLGLTWEEAFQTGDRETVERYCAEHGMEATWGDDELRTETRRPSTRTAVSSGEEVWFNQANLFHPSSLDREVREALLELYGEDELPRNVRYGDGSPIPDADIAAITEAYGQTALSLPWEEGSVLIIDNMRMAHGRQAFTGARRILVAMT